MAKDAKGHGSDGRGTQGGRLPHPPGQRRQQPAVDAHIKKTSTTTYPDSGQTISRVHWGNGSITQGSPDNTHMQQLLARGQREGAPHEVSGEAHVASIAAGHGIPTDHLRSSIDGSVIRPGNNNVGGNLPAHFGTDRSSAAVAAAERLLKGRH